MAKRTVIRLFDHVFAALERPGIRRVRRWSFVVTIPLGLLAAHALGLRPSLQDGLLVGVTLIALDAIVLLGAVTIGLRLLGCERRDALLDLLIHPLARRAMSGELRLLGVYPRALLRRLRRPSRAAWQFSYHRGSSSIAIAIALLPVLAAESAAIHLLLPGDWLIVKFVLLGLQAYSAIVLVGLAIAERVHPHEVSAGALELRLGTLYRASIPLHCIESLTPRRERAGGRSGLTLDGDAARLASSGRTDFVLTLREPVAIERPIREPVSVTRIAFAADDPPGLQAALASPPAAPAPRRRPGWLPAPDVLELIGT